MKKQILSAVLISTMLAATLAGCGSKAADPTTAAPAAQTEAAKGEETKAPETEAKAEEPKVDDANLSEVEKIIKEAESMSMEELAKKGNRRVQRKDLLRSWQLQPWKDRFTAVHRILTVHRSFLYHGI